MAHSAPHSLTTAAGFVSPVLSQRAVTFAGIVALHAVLVYFLATGLASTTIKRVLASTEVTFLKDPPRTRQTPPPPPSPTFVKPNVIDIPPPEVPVVLGSERATTITGTVVSDPPRVTPIVPAHIEPIHLVGKNQLPNTEDYYPPVLRRLGIEGTANVSVCVDEKGRRQGDPTVTQSSGDARLDAAALAVARAGRYARSARGDVFVPNCHGFRIIFRMN